jgi:hypothetical protein
MHATSATRSTRGSTGHSTPGALLGGQVDADAPVLLDHARLAAIALTRATAATAATADDRMLVPDELANGLAHLLAVYLVATAIG